MAKSRVRNVYEPGEGYTVHVTLATVVDWDRKRGFLLTMVLITVWSFVSFGKPLQLRPSALTKQPMTLSSAGQVKCSV